MSGSEPSSIIWDNISKAEFFLAKCEQQSDIPLEWCLENVANGLWAAVQVLNKSGGSSTRPGKWFAQNGEAVLKIRNAVEHCTFEWGVGQTFTPSPDATTDDQGIVWHTVGDRSDEGRSVQTFVWGLASDRPIGDILAELRETCRRVRALVLSHTGEMSISFHVQTKAATPPASIPAE